MYLGKGGGKALASWKSCAPVGVGTMRRLRLADAKAEAISLKTEETVRERKPRKTIVHEWRKRRRDRCKIGERCEKRDIQDEKTDYHRGR